MWQSSTSTKYSQYDIWIIINNNNHLNNGCFRKMYRTWFYQGFSILVVFYCFKMYNILKVFTLLLLLYSLYWSIFKEIWFFFKWLMFLLLCCCQAVSAVLRGQWMGAGVTTAQAPVSVKWMWKAPAVTAVRGATTAWAPLTLWAVPVSCHTPSHHFPLKYSKYIHTVCIQNPQNNVCVKTFSSEISVWVFDYTDANIY